MQSLGFISKSTQLSQETKKALYNFICISLVVYMKNAISGCVKSGGGLF